MFELVNPRQTVLVSCRGETNILGKEVQKDNFLAIDWHSPLNFDPFKYGISVGKARLSYELISKTKCYVVNFMPNTLVDKVLQGGRTSGKHTDKFERVGLTVEEAEKIDCPIIKECVGFLEIEVTEEVDLGDHVFFIGNVMREHLKVQSKRPFHTVKDGFTTTKD